MDKPLRLKEIAEKLGVSLSTVSRVLNDKPGISQTTRELVLKELRQYKDDLSPVVKSALPANGRFIGVIGRKRPGQKDSVYFHHSTLVFDEIFRASGYQSLSIPVTDEEIEDISRIPALQNNCDAFIVRGQSLPPRFIMEVQALGKPVVLLENRLSMSHFDSVVCGDRDGARRMAELLIARGYERVIHITGPDQWYCNRERILGYRDAMESAGKEAHVLSMEDTTIQTGEGSLELIRGITKERCAVMAVNDAMALGLINRARAAGLSVPGDMGVSGFDDIPWSAMSYPPLTTMRIHIDKMGKYAALRALQLMDEDDPVPVEMSLPVDLVEREST